MSNVIVTNLTGTIDTGKIVDQLVALKKEPIAAMEKEVNRYQDKYDKTDAFVVKTKALEDATTALKTATEENKNALLTSYVNAYNDMKKFVDTNTQKGQALAGSNAVTQEYGKIQTSTSTEYLRSAGVSFDKSGTLNFSGETTTSAADIQAKFTSLDSKYDNITSYTNLDKEAAKNKMASIRSQIDVKNAGVDQYESLQRSKFSKLEALISMLQNNNMNKFYDNSN